jgi:hypothetical protein
MDQRICVSEKGEFDKSIDRFNMSMDEFGVARFPVSFGMRR